jgi:hypothetical protein
MNQTGMNTGDYGVFLEIPPSAKRATARNTTKNPWLPQYHPER